MSEWRKFEEEQPAEGQLIAYRTDYPGVYAGNYHKDQFGSLIEWCPLPEPEKDEDEFEKWEKGYKPGSVDFQLSDLRSAWNAGIASVQGRVIKDKPRPDKTSEQKLAFDANLSADLAQLDKVFEQAKAAVCATEVPKPFTDRKELFEFLDQFESDPGVYEIDGNLVDLTQFSTVFYAARDFFKKKSFAGNRTEGFLYQAKDIRIDGNLIRCEGYQFPKYLLIKILENFRDYLQS